VHAFEPLRPVYHQLAGNVALNELDNVLTYNVALVRAFNAGEILWC
jgi:hypothetical protein